jgi:hypothetical protein
MTLSVKHKFTNPKGDPADTTLVRPSNWNDEHAITLAADSVIGRDSSGSGAAQEVACTAQGRAILAAATVAALCAALGIGVSTTGDVKFTIKTAADAGWIMADDGTIGSATSLATTRANADCADLYAALWAIPDTYAPVTGGRGVSATADFAANKPIALTKMLGRALAVAGAGSGLTARALGAPAGAETVAISQANLPNVSLPVTIPSAQLPFLTDVAGVDTQFFSPGGSGPPLGGLTKTLNASSRTGTAALGGSGTVVDKVQPTSFLNVMVKL